MKKKIKIFVCCFWLIACSFCCAVSAQSVSPFVIGSTGNFSTAGFGSLSSSVGEPVISTVGSGSVTLTQGFQQPITTSNPPLVITATDTPSVICRGASSTLQAIVVTSLFPPFSYSWSPAGSLSSSNISNPVATPSASTTYSVLVTDANSTTGTATVTVTVKPTPTVSISASTPTTICIGSHTTLTALTNGAGYYWSTGSSGSSIIVSPTINTGYSVTVGSSNGCSSTSSTAIHVGSSLTASLSVTPSSINAYCQASTTTLAASGGTSYSWSTSPAQTTSSIAVTPLLPGNYTYSVFVSNGSCSVDTSVTITIKPLPNISISVSPSPTICMGDAATLTGQGGTSYIWSTVTGPSTIVSPTTNTTYTVIGIGSNGCAFYSSTNITVGSFTVTAGNNQTICPGNVVQLSASAAGDTAGMSYEWWAMINGTDSLLQTPSANFSVNPDTMAFYMVRGVNGNYCYSEKDTVWVFMDGTCDIHIYSGFTPNGDGKNDTWWIDNILSYPKNDVVIFNRWGTNVWSGKNYDNDKVIWKGTNYSGQPLPDGTYYYVVNYFDSGDKKTTRSGWVEVTH